MRREKKCQTTKTHISIERLICVRNCNCRRKRRTERSIKRSKNKQKNNFKTNRELTHTHYTSVSYTAHRIYLRKETEQITKEQRIKCKIIKQSRINMEPGWWRQNLLCHFFWRRIFFPFLFVQTTNCTPIDGTIRTNDS